MRRDRRSDRRRQPVRQQLLDSAGRQRGNDLRGGRALRRVLLQAGAYQAEEGLRYAGDVRFPVDDLVEHRGVRCGAFAEGVAAGSGEGENGAEREDVPCGADVLPQSLLGWQIAGRADDNSRLRHTVSVHRPRDAEVDDARAVRSQQDVGRLEVAVDQADCVDFLESGGETCAQRADRVLGEGPVRLDQVGQVGAEDVRRREPWQCRVRGRVHDRGRVAARDRAGHLDLVLETAAEVDVGGQVLAYDLDRDRTTTRRACEIDPAHASRAESPQQPVAAQLPWIVGLQCLHGRGFPVRSCGPQPGWCGCGAYGSRDGVRYRRHSSNRRDERGGRGGGRGRWIGEAQAAEGGSGCTAIQALTRAAALPPHTPPPR